MHDGCCPHDDVPHPPSPGDVAYIIQPLVLVPAAVLLQGAAWPALAKFVVVAALAVVVAYSLARALRLLPVVRRVVG